MSEQRQQSFQTGLIMLALLLLLLATACKPSPGKLNEDGNAAFANEDYGAALSDYQQAQTAGPDTAEPYYNAANTLYRQEDYNNAQGQMQQALQHAQGDLNQNSLYNLGNSYYSAEKLEAAIIAYQEALLLNPNDLDAKYNLELALQQQQQPTPEPTAQPTPTPQSGDQPTPTPQSGDQPTPTPNTEGQPTPDANGQPTPQAGDQQDQNGQAQPTPNAEGLTPEQAQQLLSAVTQNSQTLQQKLQQIYTVSQPPPAEDW